MDIEVLKKQFARINFKQDRSKVNSFLLDYYAGNRKQGNRLMKAYDAGIKNINFDQNMFLNEYNKIIHTLVNDEDMQYVKVRDVVATWADILGIKMKIYINENLVFYDYKNVLKNSVEQNDRNNISTNSKKNLSENSIVNTIDADFTPDIFKNINFPFGITTAKGKISFVIVILIFIVISILIIFLFGIWLKTWSAIFVPIVLFFLICLWEINEIKGYE